MSEKNKQSSLKGVQKQIKVYRFLDYKPYLRALYDALNKANGKYTHEQFTSDLGIAKPNYTAEVIGGLVPLSMAMAQKISASLGLGKLESRYLEALVPFINASNTKEREEALYEMLRLKQRLSREKLDDQWLQLITAWQHLAILEMVGVEGFKPDPSWIRKQLLVNLRPLQISKSLQLLEELGLVRTEDGKMQKVQETFDTGPEIKGLEANSLYLQMIELSKDALAKTPWFQRDFSCLTFALDEVGMQKVKQVLHDAQEEVLKISAESAQRSRVCQLNMQFFPITRDVTGKRGKKS